MGALLLVACGGDSANDVVPSVSGPDGLADVGDGDPDDSPEDGPNDGSVLSCATPVAVSGDVTISGAAEIDFCENANAVEGSLILTGAAFGDDQIEQLSCLCSVGGALVVDGTDVSALDALDRLSTVGGLELTDNAMLQSIQGLANVASLDGDVVISGSPSLTNLVGLGAVETMGAVTLSDLGLVNLRGLESLTTVEGDLTLFDLYGLVDMTGAGALDFVDGNFIVEQTGAHDFAGLDSIRRVRQALIVRDSEASLDGLDHLATVGGSIILERVARLSSLNGLSGVAEIGGHLRIDEAPTLNSLVGPSNLRNINGSLWLTQTNVSALNGLSRLVAVGGLHLDTNPELVSTAGLPPVVNYSELVLHWNASLVDLTHLDTVRSVEGALTVSGHVSLAHLDELYSLESVGGDVTLVNNVSLSSDEANDLVNAIGRDNIGGVIDVSGNSG
jgi:hypothetical protein